LKKKRKGSLEVGKWADLVIYDKDLMKIQKSNSRYETSEYVFKGQNN
jgi:predicted amidohydrolase YtcJ